MKQAKPSEADYDSVLRFFQAVEEALNNGQWPNGIAEAVDKHFPFASWERVYWAGLTCIHNACDPDLDYLQFKPEIREREKEVERLKGELEFYRSRCEAIERRFREWPEPAATEACNILANGKHEP